MIIISKILNELKNKNQRENRFLQIENDLKKNLNPLNLFIDNEEIINKNNIDNNIKNNKIENKKIINKVELTQHLEENHILIEKDSYYRIKTNDELKKSLKEFNFEDLFLDNNNFREILLIYFQILDNNFELFEDEFFKSNDKNSISNIPKIKDYINLINENKRNINKILKNKLSESSKKYIIKKNEGSYGKIYQNNYNKTIIIKNFDLEKTDLVDVYLEYFIQYIIYHFSNDNFKEHISQPFDLKITPDFKSARIFMKKIDGITFHSFINKNIVNYEKNNEKNIIIKFIKILINICNLFIFLQNRFGFVHFDLHLANIMLDNEDFEKIFLVDYGFSSINFKYNEKKDKIFIVSKPKHLIFSKIDNENRYKLKFKYKTIDMLNMFLRLSTLIFNKMNDSTNIKGFGKKNILISKIYNILNYIFSFQDIEDIKNIVDFFKNKTLYEYLRNELKDNINISYRYSTNYYFLKKDLKPKLSNDEYKRINIVIDRFNPIHLKKILSFCIENINIFLLT